MTLATTEPERSGSKKTLEQRHFKLSWYSSLDDLTVLRASLEIWRFRIQFPIQIDFFSLMSSTLETIFLTPIPTSNFHFIYY